MMNVSMECRTINVTKPFQVVQRNGKNGSFEKKEIFFRVACNRGNRTVTDENGNAVQKNEADFFLVKAEGANAERFNQYCTATKADGKLQSRHLLLCGHFETYQNTRKVTKKCSGVDKIPVNGMYYQYSYSRDETFDVEETGIMFVVSNDHYALTFLDSNPNSNNVSVSTPGETVISNVVAIPMDSNEMPSVVSTPAQPVAQTPVAQPVVNQPVATTVQSQPVVITPPVQTVVQPTTQVSQPTVPVAQTEIPVIPQAVADMNPPVVDSSFIPNIDSECPFA